MALGSDRETGDASARTEYGDARDILAIALDDEAEFVDARDVLPLCAGRRAGPPPGRDDGPLHRADSAYVDAREVYPIFPRKPSKAFVDAREVFPIFTGKEPAGRALKTWGRALQVEDDDAEFTDAREVLAIAPNGRASRAQAAY